MSSTPVILYEDRFLAVCIKPVGISSEDPMCAALSEQLGGRFFCVHRLDTDVSGVMVYAKDGKTAAALSEQFAGHMAVKEYLAVLCGTPETPSGTLTDLLYHDSHSNKTFVVKRMRHGVKEAVLEYETVSADDKRSVPLTTVRVLLHTGRSHQIRVQFASRKLPLLGDTRYGAPVRSEHIGLFSFRLTFEHPRTHKQMVFSAEPWTGFGIPKDN